jgi:hypothetical protein
MIQLTHYLSDMRKIVGQYTTRMGELKAIYSVQGSVMKHKDIELGCRYELAYKLGRFEGYLNAVLMFTTDDHRTLFFKNPEGIGHIGVPIMNILKYIKK